MLADPDVMERIPRRAYIAKLGISRLRFDDLPNSSWHGHEVPKEPVAVLEVRRKSVRVVSDADGARVALWIDDGDAAPVAAVAARLTDEAGGTNGDTGVWLAPGARLELRDPQRERHQVHVVSSSLRVTGWIAKRAIGIVWNHAKPAQFGPTATVAAFTTLREAPDDTSPIIADTLVAVGAIPGEPRGRWMLVEVSVDRVHVRGFVPAASVAMQPPEEDGSITLGNIYTISGTLKIDVPAGACLYDRADGEVVGVNTRARSRLGHRRETDWQDVYVDGPWGTRALYVRAERDSFESCLP
jgi:hypothetical protein